MEVPPIENPHLLGTHEQGTGHMTTGREPANVPCQQPCSRVGHAVLRIDQPEVPQGYEPIHPLRDLGAFTEPRPSLVAKVVFHGKSLTGLLVEMEAHNRVEQVFHFVIRHLLTARPVSYILQIVTHCYISGPSFPA